MDLVLTPKPWKLKIGNGRWTPPANLSSSLSKLTVTALTMYGLPKGMTSMMDPTLPKGGYRLHIKSGGVEIQGADERGVFYAAQTLRQILRQADSDGSIPEMEIRDFPKFQNRGFMLDISRNRIPTMETFHRIIDLMAELKLNELQLYMESAFAYKGHKKVWEAYSPLTAEEVKDLDVYAADRGIELVPNQNLLGHMERWLKFPEYRELAEAPDGAMDPWGGFRETPTTLDPSSPDVLEFVRDLLDQLLPVFSSVRFNAGLDEPFDIGQGKNLGRVETDGGPGSIFLEYLYLMRREVTARGFQMQFWADFLLEHPEMVPAVPKDVTAMVWGYESEHPFAAETARLAEAKIPFYVCPGTSSWNTIVGRWTNCRENIGAAVISGEKSGAVGFLNTDWGDNGHMQELVVSMPGLFAGAEGSWSGAAGLDRDWTGPLSLHLFGTSEITAADTLLALGDLYKEIPVQIDNRSFVALPLFEHVHSYVRDKFSDLRKSGIGKSREILDKARENLKGASVDTDFRGGWAGQMKQQLLLAADLCDHGLKALSAYLRSPEAPDDSPILSSLQSDDKAVLMDELVAILPRFEEIWLASSRPGGLKETKGILGGLLEIYRGK